MALSAIALFAGAKKGADVCYAYIDRYDLGFVPIKELGKEYFKERKAIVFHGNLSGKTFVVKKRGGLPETIVAIDPGSGLPYVDPPAGMGAGKTPVEAVRKARSFGKRVFFGKRGDGYDAFRVRRDFGGNLLEFLSETPSGTVNPPYEKVYAVKGGSAVEIGYCSKIKGYPKTSFAVPLSADYLDTEKLSFSPCDSMGKRKSDGNFVCLYYGDSVIPDESVKKATALIYPDGDPLDGYVYWNYMENQNPYLLGVFDGKRVSIDLCFERVGFSEIASLRPMEECGILSVQAGSPEDKKILEVKYGTFPKRFGGSK